MFNVPIYNTKQALLWGFYMGLNIVVGLTH